MFLKHATDTLKHATDTLKHVFLSTAQEYNIDYDLIDHGSCDLEQLLTTIQIIKCLYFQHTSLISILLHYEFYLHL